MTIELRQKYRTIEFGELETGVVFKPWYKPDIYMKVDPAGLYNAVNLNENCLDYFKNDYPVTIINGKFIEI